MYYVGLLVRAILTISAKIRWAYFHVHPDYTKIWMDEEKNKAHFYHFKTNSLHSNYVWKSPNENKTQTY